MLLAIASMPYAEVYHVVSRNDVYGAHSSLKIHKLAETEAVICCGSCEEIQKQSAFLVFKKIAESAMIFLLCYSALLPHKPIFCPFVEDLNHHRWSLMQWNCKSFMHIKLYNA